MPTLKYNNAPDLMNCNHNECSFNLQLGCTQELYLNQLKPCGPGYTQDVNWPGGGMPYYKFAPGDACWAGEWKRVCRRLPPYDDYWNPLQTSLISETGPPNGYTPANIKKANRCCSNVAASNAEKEECGELLWEGTGPKPTKCGSILKRWCELDENITDPVCFETVVSDPKYFGLDEKCKSKTPGSKWDNLCVCRYSSDFYQGINKSISDVWNVPPEYMDPRPECMYPQCKRSETRDKTAVCAPTSFTQCIQNANFTANGSNVGDVSIKPDANCLSYTKIKKPVVPTGTTGTTGPVAAVDPKIAEENAKNQKMMFIAFIIIVAVIFLLQKKRRPTSTKGGTFLDNDSDVEGGENNLMLNSY